MNKKIAALLAIALLIPLVGCSGSAAMDDVPSSNIESQSPPEAPETPTGAIESTDPNQDPTPSEKPIEPTQEPIESEPPEETIAPTMEPTKQPEQAAPTSSPASSAPVSTPTHTHSYTSTVTKQPTCSEEGINTYTCSTCGNAYNETIGKTNDHEWITLHIDEVGHYEDSGTHTVYYQTCHCGFEVNSDMPNADAIWREHTRGCPGASSIWSKEVPNGEPKYVVDVPGYDKVYCYLCGVEQ